MSTEINTRGMIRAKISPFPSGNDNECMTKAEIIGSNVAIVNGSYGDNECPVLDDVQLSVCIGYIGANGEVKRLYDPAKSPVIDTGPLLNICDALYVIIIGKPIMSNASKVMAFLEKALGEQWLKVPAVDGWGSIALDPYTGKINDNLCTIKLIPANLPSFLNNGNYRYNAIFYNGDSKVDEIFFEFSLAPQN